MKKLLTFLFLLIAAFAFVATAEPCSIPTGETLIYKDSGIGMPTFSKFGLQSHVITFDLSGDFKSIENACLSIYLQDDDGSIFDLFEYASIFFEGEKVVCRDEVDGWFDKNLIEKYSFDSHQILPHLDDMILDIEIKWDRPWLCFGKGDFYYQKSILKVCGSPVPIPGTGLLLASGLIGLVAIKERGLRKVSSQVRIDLLKRKGET